MKIDPVPVWTFFEIPENAIELCHRLAKENNQELKDNKYWQRAARFLEEVKLNTVDQLPERDFDWLLRLRVQFERDADVTNVKKKIKDLRLKN